MTHPALAPFGTRLHAAVSDVGRLCIGIDPHPSLLESWGLPDNPAALRSFSDHVIEAATGRVAAVKPQSAFFERHGSAGIAVLEQVIGQCADRGLLCILDAKRGDIGSTMAAYADAYLRTGSPLAADALTLSPYLGFGSLREAIDVALAHQRGVFVLALTSNKDGSQVQHARDTDGGSVAQSICAAAAAHNAEQVSAGDPLGSVGLVIGATVGTAPAALGMDLAGLRGPVLAPGIGTQGGTGRDLDLTFGTTDGVVLASASRSVLRAGPDHEALIGAIESLKTELEG